MQIAASFKKQTAHRTKYIVTLCVTDCLVLCGVAITPHRDRTTPPDFISQEIEDACVRY